MRTKQQRVGFSLMEVNMAVFILAIGILSVAALFPLGLRESAQGQADLKQAMLADYLLNQAVAAASRSDVKWSREWCEWAQQNRPPQDGSLTLHAGVNNLPPFVRDYMKAPNWNGATDNKQFRISCCVVPGFSDRLMGIMVVSTDMASLDNYNQYSNNPVYYAEAMFQGDLTQ